MLRIRKKQMGEFSTAMLRRADLRLAVYARKRFPAIFRKTTDTELGRFVENVRAEAKKHGIEREDNVATFLDFTVMYGQEFAGSSWAADILKCDALHGPDKVAILRHRVEQTGVAL